MNVIQVLRDYLAVRFPQKFSIYQQVEKSLVNIKKYLNLFQEISVIFPKDQNKSYHNSIKK